MSTINSPQTEVTPLPNLLLRQRGLSLIELLIALALGVIIVVAMSQLFVNISRANTEMAKTNSQIESARFAMQFLQGDIVHAGYWAGFIPQFDDLTLPVGPPPTVPSDVPTAKPNPVCLPYTTAASWNANYQATLLGIPIEVYGPGATPPGCGGVITDRLADTDLLIVRHLATCVAGEANCDSIDANTLYMRVSNCKDDLVRYALNYQADGSPDPNYANIKKLDCDPAILADQRKFVQNIYYIRSWANDPPSMTDPDGDGIPTLVRSEFGAVGGIPQQEVVVTPLVEGIERFRVELGIEENSETGGAIDNSVPIVWWDEDVRTTPRNRGDGVPEKFESCLSDDVDCTVEELINVVAVKLYILARATEETQGYTDDKSYTLGSAAAESFNNSFKRHLFNATIRVNNVAGRRETPFDPTEVESPP
jgi:type IV pilus assembly protein PilW